MRDVEMAAYLDRRLSGTDRELAEAHLADCAECREELAQSYQLLKRLRRPRRLAMGGLVAAIAATLVLVVRPGIMPWGSPADDSPLRGNGDGAAIVAYGPIGETLAAPVQFVWGAESTAITYRLTVTSADGATIWSGSAADTTVVLPDSIALRAGERYRWVVDALLDDGATRSTGLREFRVAP
jgi:hypothetical protein